nr:MAG TPA: hypothetical protein [Caudoviricetes sp.]
MALNKRNNDCELSKPSQPYYQSPPDYAAWPADLYPPPDAGGTMGL